MPDTTTSDRVACLECGATAPFIHIEPRWVAVYGGGTIVCDRCGTISSGAALAAVSRGEGRTQ